MWSSTFNATELTMLSGYIEATREKRYNSTDSRREKR